MERIRIKIKNWSRYQAKPRDDRAWNWIKVHPELMRDFHFTELSQADKWHLVGLWCLADSKTGIVEMEEKEILFMLGAKSLTLKNFDHFIETLAAKPRRTAAKPPRTAATTGETAAQIAPRNRRVEVYTKDATLETETEADGSAKDGSSVASRRDGFVEFWRLYPAGRKHDKKNNRDRFMRKTRDGGATPGEIVDGLMLWIASREWTKDSGQYVPLASTFLNQNRWESAPPDPNISQSSGRPEGATL
jgi:hypothetical protein